MKINNRLNNISEYHLKKINDFKNDIIKQGIEVTDLSIGDPDLPIKDEITDALIKEIKKTGFNQYPPYEGIDELKFKIIEYYDKVFNVKLNYDEVLILIGSKEGISNIIPAVCNIGDYIMVPQPAYPVYERCAYLWGVEPYKIPLKEDLDYLVDLKCINPKVLNYSKLFFINYPNNPTGAISNADFYKEIINFCNDRDIILCNDGAYNEILNTNIKPMSILEFDSKKRSIEFGTFSKTFNMTGFRIGFAVGNNKVIKSLLKVKSNLDSGQFKPIQLAAKAALEIDRSYIKNTRDIYTARRKSAEKILYDKNIKFYKGKGTFYIWCKVPRNYTVDEFCEELISKYGIIVTPGYVFGDIGHNHFRISLTKDQKDIDSALNKLNVYS